MKNILNVLSTIILYFYVAPALCQDSSIKILTEKFFTIVEEHAYQSELVNWDSLKPIVYSKTALITNEADLEPIFEDVLSHLNDYHSGVYHSATEDSSTNNNVIKTYATLSYKKAGRDFPNLYGEMIDDQIAYVNIPGVILEHKNYINLMGSILLDLDQQNPKAWIFDITDSGGGSKPPMLWHMYSFFDTPTLYSSIQRDGHEIIGNREMWDMSNFDSDDSLFFHLAGLDDTTLRPVHIQHRDVPLIVLTSPKTASSGELFAAAFKGQKNATLLGQSTNGVTSFNKPFKLNKQYTINLMTAVIKDRHGKVYKIGEGIAPDVAFDLPENITRADFVKPEIKGLYMDKAKDVLKTLLKLD